MREVSSRSYRIRFFIIFLLICTNLRMPFAAVDPLLLYLMREMGLDVAMSSLFALLPVIILGIAAPLAAFCTRYVRPSYIIIYALCFACLGIIWRSSGYGIGLFAGTVCIGLGLGMSGTLILGLVKRVFPQRISIMTGVYTACVCLGTSLGSGLSAPITKDFGNWQAGLLFWGIPLLLSALLFGIHSLGSSNLSRLSQTPPRASMIPLLTQKKAWMIALFYLFRVAGAWLLIVWLVTLMRQRGLSFTEAGSVLALATICEIPSALISHRVADMLGSRSKLMVLSLPLSIVGCIGLLLGPLEWWPAFAILFGVNIGFIFSLGINLIVASSKDEATTIALSGLSQGLGFVGGGLFAWACCVFMLTDNPHLSIAIVYTCITLLGLYFGLKSDQPGEICLSPQKSSQGTPD